MLIGPVLRFECVTTARRGRYYALRAVYGLFLLYNVWTSYARQGAMYGGRIDSPHDMAVFAESVFSSLGYLQWIAMLVIVPAMTAGVIADAHRRKTLRDLLSSGLSARAIVLGKLTARLGHVAALVAVGIPVTALIGLFGGLDPWIVFDVYAGTASIALAVGGVSILASTLARRPREAIITAYVLEIGWLIVPPMMSTLLPHMAWPFPLLVPVNEFLVWTNPLRVASEMTSRSYWPRNATMMPWLKNMISQMHYAVATMVVLQMVLGLFCAGLAAFLIRKLRAGDREGRASQSWLEMIRARASSQKKPNVSPINRPPIGDDPMIWKEWHAAPRGGLAWLVSGPVTLILGVLLGCYLYEIAKPAFLEFWRIQDYGYFRGRNELNHFIRMISSLLMTVWLLAVASAGSVSITSEREDDTWISLTSSLLTGREVVRAKILGAIWGTRKFAYTILAMLAVGVISGGVHPLGAVLTVTGMAAFGLFTAALGLWFSLRMSNSTRSLVAVMVTLVLVNSGFPILVSGFYAFIDNYPREESPWMVVLTIPSLQMLAPFSSEQVALMADGEVFSVLENGLNIHGPTLLAVIITGQLLYGLCASALWTSSNRAYDTIVGRAFRDRNIREDQPVRGAIS